MIYNLFEHGTRIMQSQSISLKYTFIAEYYQEEHILQ